MMKTGKSAMVYIVDDDDSVSRAMSRLVRSLGFESARFSSADQFLEQTDFPERSCIVTDVRMPGTSGLELPGLLAKRGQYIPVIFVTAYDDPEARDRARQAGAAGFFCKPVDDQALMDAIRWVLGSQPHARQQTTPTRKGRETIE